MVSGEPRRKHLPVTPGLEHHADADVRRCTPFEEAGFHVTNELDVIVARDLRVRFGLEKVTELEVIIRRQNGAARHARNHLDVTEHVELGEPRQDTDVVERGAKAAAGKRQSDFAEEERHGSRGATAEQGGKDDEARRLAPAFDGEPVDLALQADNVGHLARGGFQTPIIRFARGGPFDPRARLIEVAEAEIGLAEGAVEPPLAFERGVRMRQSR